MGQKKHSILNLLMVLILAMWTPDFCQEPPTHNHLMYAATRCHVVMVFIQRLNLIFKHFGLFYFVASTLIQILF